MKNLEFMIIGAPHSGKTTLAKQLLAEQIQPLPKEPFHPSVGMQIHKKEHLLSSGETVRLSLWDPAVTMLPKERMTKKMNQLKEEEQQSKSVIENIKNFVTGKDQQEQGSIPFIEDFQKDTNLQLAHEYLSSGTYHFAIFVYDLTSQESFRQMEDWFDQFKSTCLKSSNSVSFAFVGTKKDKLQQNNEDQQRAFERGVSEEQVEEWVKDISEEIEKKGQRCQYFEVSSIQGKGIREVRDYMLQEAVLKYSEIEKMRYRIDLQKGKNRDCNIDSCLIF